MFKIVEQYKRNLSYYYCSLGGQIDRRPREGNTFPNNIILIEQRVWRGKKKPPDTKYRVETFRIAQNKRPLKFIDRFNSVVYFIVNRFEEVNIIICKTCVSLSRLTIVTR